MADYGADGHPHLLQTVLDTTDVRSLAEFYRQLLGLVCRPGDEPPAQGNSTWTCPSRTGRPWSGPGTSASS